MRIPPAEPDRSLLDARDPFADDVLGRLIESNQGYQRTHGHYIVPLSYRLLEARRELADERAMSRQSVEKLRDLKANWRTIIEEQDADGGPLIENILYWLIEALGGNE